MLKSEFNIHNDVIACYERLAPLYIPRTRGTIRDEYLKPLLALPRGACVLDVGCGTGHDLLSLSNAGHRVVGIDVSPAMCKIARELLDDRDGVEILEGDIDIHIFGEKRFDAVLSSMEIFHHDDLDVTLKNYASYLVTGGLLVLVTNHPVRNVLMHPEWDYFSEGFTWEDWGAHGRVPKYHWTLQHHMEALFAAGFCSPEIREYVATPDIAMTQDLHIANTGSYPSIITFSMRKESRNGQQQSCRMDN